jgi:hypothetical protein
VVAFELVCHSFLVLACRRPFFIALGGGRVELIREAELALLLVIVQTLLLIAGLSLFGQLVVGLFSWGRRGENIVYQVLAIIGRPAVRVARLLTPRLVLDRHVPAVAFLLCLSGYLVVGLYHRSLCLQDLSQSGCEKWRLARSR